MATFVLVHGMWHGGWCWKKVTPFLRRAGHEVHTPTLTGLGERVHLARPEMDVDVHILDVVNLVMYEELHNVILVGHSFGGSLAPAIVEKIPERIAHLVNLDGPLPENGKALKDLIGDTWGFFLQNAILPGDEGRIQPISDWTFGVSGPDLEWMQSKLTPHPLKTLTTPLFFTNPLAYSIPRTFISCTETPLSNAEVTAEEKKYAKLGWNYRFIPTGHDAMITAPQALANVLLDLSRSNS